MTKKKQKLEEGDYSEGYLLIDNGNLKYMTSYGSNQMTNIEVIFLPVFSVEEI